MSNDEYYLKSNKFVHETFVEVYNLISKKSEEFANESEEKDKTKWLIMNRIVNRLYIQLNNIAFNSAEKNALKDGDI